MLDFNQTLLFQFLNLFILAFLLNFFLFKPIVRALQKRQEVIGNLGDRTDENRALKEGLEKQYEDNRRAKQQPIIAQRDTVIKDAHSASMKVIEEARNELAGELAKVKDTVKNEADKTLETLKNESERLSQEITAKILRRGA